MVVVQEAEASEPTITVVPVAEATEPVVAEEVKEMVDPVGLLDVTTAPKETCPAPVVYAVHPDQVTVADENPYILEEVVKSQPVFLPKEEPELFPGQNDLPPHFNRINWVLPPCLHDPKGDYMDHLRRLQLKMKIPGSEWDTGALLRMQKLEEQPMVAPYLTGPDVIRGGCGSSYTRCGGQKPGNGRRSPGTWHPRRPNRVGRVRHQPAQALLGRALQGRYCSVATRFVWRLPGSSRRHARNNGRADSIYFSVPPPCADYFTGSTEDAGDSNH